VRTYTAAAIFAGERLEPPVKEDYDYLRL
jgi:hypothetical protein